MYYIQRKGDGYLETVDEFTTKKEALAMLTEYRLDWSGHYYISSRPCKEWAEDAKNKMIIMPHEINVARMLAQD